ncbi:cocosin 1-like [Typha angustifolia]|uniref:cocosin 1-like n=1 Tax=Typha angustifolia TaxID=59011 RepID=UPI003C2BED56
MAIPNLSFLSLPLCFLFFFFFFSHAQSQTQFSYAKRRYGEQSRCRVERLHALEPVRRLESEAGVTEYYDESNEQLECAGVSAMRQTIESNGLLLPSYSNAPHLVYILQGNGITSAVISGCPETYQSYQESEQGRRYGERQGQQMFQDEHQKIYRFRQGDILALPAGVAHWFYNDGETPVVTFTVFDTSNSANQLDRTHRHFLLAGKKQGQQSFFSSRESKETSSNNNIFNGFDLELLAEALGVSRETARKLQGQDDQRGHIVRVERGLQVLKPRRTEESTEWEEEQEEEGRRRRRAANGIDEAICFMKLRENVGDPMKADLYTPGGGRITVLNSQKLPILRFIQMSANRGVLNRNAILAPHWNINSHAVVFVISGRARLQIVGNQGSTAFDGELRQGQLMVVPQNFAVIAQARSEGFSWISIQTIDNAMNNAIVGKTSAFRGMPADVLANSFGISREEAMRLKFSRGQEMAIFSPKSKAIGYGDM